MLTEKNKAIYGLLGALGLAVAIPNHPADTGREPGITDRWTADDGCVYSFDEKTDLPTHCTNCPNPRHSQSVDQLSKAGRAASHQAHRLADHLLK
jgi:hypothetical protein